VAEPVCSVTITLIRCFNVHQEIYEHAYYFPFSNSTRHQAMAADTANPLHWLAVQLDMASWVLPRCTDTSNLRHFGPKTFRDCVWCRSVSHFCVGAKMSRTVRH